MRDNQTKMITTGAVFVAVFVILLFINRVTGGTLRGIVYYILPIPMVVYSAKFGLKPGIPVVLAMTFSSVFFANPLTIILIFLQCVIGLSLGSCFYYKVDMTKALFLCMFLAALANILNSIVLAALISGQTLRVQAESMISMIELLYTQMGVDEAIIAQFTELSFVMRMIIVCAILMGLVDGTLIFTISRWVLRRLHFQVPKLPSVYTFFPWQWTGWLAFLLVLLYGMAYDRLKDGPYLEYLQTAAICGYFYLVVFGIIGMLFFAKVLFPKYLWVAWAAAILALIKFPIFLACAGYFYICSYLHRQYLPSLDKKENNP